MEIGDFLNIESALIIGPTVVPAFICLFGAAISGKKATDLAKASSIVGLIYIGILCTIYTFFVGLLGKLMEGFSYTIFLLLIYALIYWLFFYFGNLIFMARKKSEKLESKG